MDFAQGLYNRVEESEKTRRSFNFIIGGGSIFPLSFDSCSGLGYEYAGCGVGVVNTIGLAWPRLPLPVFKTYVEQKQRTWENIQPEVASDRCLIL